MPPRREDDDPDRIEEDHLDGEHFGNPTAECDLCEIDDDAPECPDPW